MAIGKDFQPLEKRIGYVFSDKDNLDTALTHSSFANELRSRGIAKPSNERLEFLGDAVLEIVVSDSLYQNGKSYNEGTLTKIRQMLVCEKTLSKIAAEIDLGSYVHLGRGEENTDCRARPKVLADTLEALFGAIYLDGGGIGAVSPVILSLFAGEIENLSKSGDRDYKTMLQKLVEKDGSATLEYEVTEETGPEHDKRFAVACKINNNVVGRGIAPTKKEAEKKAAGEALVLFGISVSTPEERKTPCT